MKNRKKKRISLRRRSFFESKRYTPLLELFLFFVCALDAQFEQCIRKHCNFIETKKKNGEKKVELMTLWLISYKYRITTLYIIFFSSSIHPSRREFCRNGEKNNNMITKQSPKTRDEEQMRLKKKKYRKNRKCRWLDT